MAITFKFHKMNKTFIISLIIGICIWNRISASQSNHSRVGNENNRIIASNNGTSPSSLDVSRTPITQGASTKLISVGTEEKLSINVKNVSINIVKPSSGTGDGKNRLKKMQLEAGEKLANRIHYPTAGQTSLLRQHCPPLSATCPICLNETKWVLQDICNFSIVMKLLLLSTPQIDGSGRVCGKFGMISVSGKVEHKQFRRLLRFSLNDICECPLKSSRQYFLFSQNSTFMKDGQLFSKISLSNDAFLILGNRYSEAEIFHKLEECAISNHQPPIPYDVEEEPIQPRIAEKPSRPPPPPSIVLTPPTNYPSPPQPQYTPHIPSPPIQDTTSPPYVTPPVSDSPPQLQPVPETKKLHYLPDSELNLNSLDPETSRPKQDQLPSNVLPPLVDPYAPSAPYVSPPPPFYALPPASYVPSPAPPYAPPAPYAPPPAPSYAPPISQPSTPPPPPTYTTPKPVPYAPPRQTPAPYQVDYLQRFQPTFSPVLTSCLYPPTCPKLCESINSRVDFNKVYCAADFASVVAVTLPNRFIVNRDGKDSYYDAGSCLKIPAKHMFDVSPKTVPKNAFLDLSLLLPAKCNCFQDLKGPAIILLLSSHGLAPSPPIFQLTRSSDLFLLPAPSNTAMPHCVVKPPRMAYAPPPSAANNTSRALPTSKSAVYTSAPVVIHNYATGSTKFAIRQTSHGLLVPQSISYSSSEYSHGADLQLPYAASVCPPGIQHSCPELYGALDEWITHLFCASQFALVTEIRETGPLSYSYSFPTVTMVVSKSYRMNTVTIRISDPSQNHCIRGTLKVIQKIFPISNSYILPNDIPFVSFAECPLPPIAYGHGVRVLIFSPEAPRFLPNGELPVNKDLYIIPLPAYTQVPVCNSPHNEIHLPPENKIHPVYHTLAPPVYTPPPPVYTPGSHYQTPAPQVYKPSPADKTPPVYTPAPHYKRPVSPTYKPTPDYKTPAPVVYTPAPPVYTPGSNYQTTISPTYKSTPAYKTPVYYETPIALQYTPPPPAVHSPTPDDNPYKPTYQPRTENVYPPPTKPAKWYTTPSHQVYKQPVYGLTPAPYSLPYVAKHPPPPMYETCPQATNSCPICAEALPPNFADYFCISQLASIVAVGLDYYALKREKEDPRILPFIPAAPPNLYYNYEAYQYGYNVTLKLNRKEQRRPLTDQYNYDSFCYKERVRSLYDITPSSYESYEKIEDIDIFIPTSCECQPFDLSPAFAILLTQNSPTYFNQPVQLTDRYAFFPLPKEKISLPDCHHRDSRAYPSILHSVTKYSVPNYNLPKKFVDCVSGPACSNTNLNPGSLVSIPCNAKVAALVEVIETSVGPYVVPTLEILKYTSPYTHQEIISFLVKSNAESELENDDNDDDEDDENVIDGYEECRYAKVKVVSSLSSYSSLAINDVFTLVVPSHCTSDLFLNANGYAVFISEKPVSRNSVISVEGATVKRLPVGTTMISLCSSKPPSTYNPLSSTSAPISYPLPPAPIPYNPPPYSPATLAPYPYGSSISISYNTTTVYTTSTSKNYETLTPTNYHTPSPITYSIPAVANYNTPLPSNYSTPVPSDHNKPYPIKYHTTKAPYDTQPTKPANISYTSPAIDYKTPIQTYSTITESPTTSTHFPNSMRSTISYSTPAPVSYKPTSITYKPPNTATPYETSRSTTIYTKASMPTRPSSPTYPPYTTPSTMNYTTLATTAYKPPPDTYNSPITDATYSPSTITSYTTPAPMPYKPVPSPYNPPTIDTTYSTSPPVTHFTNLTYKPAYSTYKSPITDASYRTSPMVTRYTTPTPIPYRPVPNTYKSPITDETYNNSPQITSYTMSAYKPAHNTYKPPITDAPYKPSSPTETGYTTPTTMPYRPVPNTYKPPITYTAYSTSPQITSYTMPAYKPAHNTYSTPITDTPYKTSSPTETGYTIPTTMPYRPAPNTYKPPITYTAYSTSPQITSYTMPAYKPADNTYKPPTTKVPYSMVSPEIAYTDQPTTLLSQPYTPASILYNTLSENAYVASSPNPYKSPVTDRYHTTYSPTMVDNNNSQMPFPPSVPSGMLHYRNFNYSFVDSLELCKDRQDNSCPVCFDVNSISPESYCNSKLALLGRPAGKYIIGSPTCVSGLVNSVYDLTPYKSFKEARIQIFFTLPNDCFCPALNAIDLILVMVKSDIPSITTPLNLELNEEVELHMLTKGTTLSLPKCVPHENPQPRTQDEPIEMILDPISDKLRSRIPQNAKAKECPTIHHSCPKCHLLKEDELEDLLCHSDEASLVSAVRDPNRGPQDIPKNERIVITQNVASNYSVSILIKPYEHEDACSLPVREGKCNVNSVRYYYDSLLETCNEFEYTGCDGNGNNFESEEECEKRCMEKDYCHEGNLKFEKKIVTDEFNMGSNFFNFAIPEYCECPHLFEGDRLSYLVYNMSASDFYGNLIQFTNEFYIIPTSESQQKTFYCERNMNPMLSKPFDSIEEDGISDLAANNNGQENSSAGINDYANGNLTVDFDNSQPFFNRDDVNSDLKEETTSDFDSKATDTIPEENNTGKKKKPWYLG